ncbi:MAG: SpoIID/LytB domain-containing protein [Planctomycetota bacterium]|nr:SpoIID/LytB domain-containing protein [Planctomycetota bacterium]
MGQRLLILDGCESRARILEAPLTLNLDETSGWRVHDVLSHRFDTDEPCSLSIRTLRTNSSVIEIEGRQYPGVLELVPIETISPGAVSSSIRSVDLVTRIAMESYIPGVLDGELYGHWPVTTFQAQAVAARSYAVAEHAYWSDRRHFDLVSGPASQVWNGIDVSEIARSAAESTRGIVLVHEGRVVPAYYSSCCGGMPASAFQAISARTTHEIPPLQPRLSPQPCCEASPVRSWELRYSLEDVASAVRESDPKENFGRLNTIRISKRNPAGRPLEYILRDQANRSISMSARRFRSMLAQLRPLGRTEPVIPKSEAMEPRVADGALVILGRGFGHGVGLCQYGARARAEAGDAWEEIVLRYYPEAGLVRSWK